MNVAVLGSGGREHSICYKLKQSSLIKNLYCIPGNAGTSDIAINVNIDLLNFKKLEFFFKKKKINYIFVGPELPLVKGIKNYFKDKIFIFGPNKFVSQLESSKIFTKNLCKKYDIPTAKFRSFNNLNGLKKYLDNFNTPIVVKADGLASGKGVIICKTKQKAFDICKKISSGLFKSSNKFIIEEFLEGEELSYFIISDGKSYKFFGSAQDHKKIGEKDTGPNTGGMGAYSPAHILNKDLEKKIINKIIDPTIKALKEYGHTYTGILYAGLIVKNNEPKLIEYNIRLGDPECQVLMTKLKTDLGKILLFCKKKKLQKIKINWFNYKTITVVASSKGYPWKTDKPSEIKNLKNLKISNNEYIFHAGTFYKNGKIFSTGGRTLNITSKDKNLKNARTKCHIILKKISWKNKYYRKDIGWRAIN